MMDLKKLKKQSKKTPVTFRLPDEVREWAKNVARGQSTTDVQLKENDVYRAIIVSYFSQERLQNVDGAELT